MAIYQARAKTRQGTNKPSLVWFLIALFVVLFLTRGVYGVWQKSKVSEENLATMEENLTELEDRKSDLEKKVTALKTERGMEQAFRESLPVAKPGEKVIILVESKSMTNDQSQAESSGWSRFWPF